MLSRNLSRTMSRMKYEAIFNRIEPFYQGMILYLLVFLSSALSWVIWPNTLKRLATSFLLLGFGVHTAGLISRIVLQGRPPVTNLYSSAVFVGWVAVLLGIIWEAFAGRKKGLVSAVASVVGFVTLIIAHHLAAAQGDTMEMMRAVLDSNFWLATHVVTITIGYGSTFLAGALAHLYIFRRVFNFSRDIKMG